MCFKLPVFIKAGYCPFCSFTIHRETRYISVKYHNFLFPLLPNIVFIPRFPLILLGNLIVCSIYFCLACVTALLKLSCSLSHSSMCWRYIFALEAKIPMNKCSSNSLISLAFSSGVKIVSRPGFTFSSSSLLLFFLTLILLFLTGCSIYLNRARARGVRKAYGSLSHS
jgi:hypothetical protein